MAIEAIKGAGMTYQGSSSSAEVRSEAAIRVEHAEAAVVSAKLAKETSAMNTKGTDADGGEGIYRWIVDPLDGTTNYVHSFPNFAVSLALEIDLKICVGIIFQPVTGECFTAVRGRGAFLNGKPIRTSSVTDVEKSLVAVGFPPGANHESPDVRAFGNVLPFTHAVRRTGSTAMNLAFTACGRLEACWNFGTKPWDAAAGVLLVQEAGGSVRGIDGKPFNVDNGHFLASGNETLQSKFQKLIHQK